MHEIVLCADEESLRDPAMIGLEGESLEEQQWLLTLSGAAEARGYIHDGGEADEIWVASSDEVDPINLAAALKRESKEMKVCLVAWRGSGSLMSRASAAGIDEVMGYPELARRYAEMKGRFQAQNPRRRTPTNPRETRNDASGYVFAAQQPAAREPDFFQDQQTLRNPRVEPAFPERVEAASSQAERQADGSARNDFGTPHGLDTAVDPATKRGYALCVVSASGGTGKSTIAALSALLASIHGYRTVLIDGDLQFGDAASMFDGEGGLTVDRVIAHPQLMDEATPPSGFPVIIGPPDRIEQSELYLQQVPGLIDRARETFDVVVVNTGSFWTESLVQMMEASSNTLFLMDQRPTSVKTVRKALELCARCGVAAHPFLFAVNRCTRKSLLSSIDISCALNGVSVAEFKDGGPVVGELCSSGMVQKLVDDRNDLCVSLNDFLGGVIPAALGGAAPNPAPFDDPGGKPKQKSKRKPFKKRGKAACL